MLEFLKRIFEDKDREITFVLLDDGSSEPSTSYNFKPSRLWNFLYATLLVVVVITLVLVMFTPLSQFLYSTKDADLRSRVIEVSKKVKTLQDSLGARDTQLEQMKNVIASDTDTSFAISAHNATSGTAAKSSDMELNGFKPVPVNELITENEVIFSELFAHAPEFPTEYPMDGTLTRGFEPQNGHYGIDIATKQGTSFKAIADGAIVSQNWTLNFGFVIQVQHNNGILTIYKHASSISKSIGDVIEKGDQLGTVADVGVLSSGSHLHLEVWKNGIPQDPNAYLIKP